MTTSEKLTSVQAANAAPQWQLLLGRLEAAYTLPTFPEAMSFVAEVGELAQALDHHPSIDIRYNTVFLATTSHDVGALTARDVRLANAVTDLAQRFGATLHPRRLTALEMVIDTMEADAIRPFWAAVLAYDEDGGGGLVDPEERNPSIWFQQLDEPRPVRNRIHIDVTVGPQEAQVRIDAAVAAGGRVVSDAAAPRFWVLADVDGNEACVCTWQGRDESPAAADADGASQD